MSNGQLWLRKWKISVADAKDSKQLDLSDLRCVFNVRRAREAQNFATISIYNLTRETEQQIIMEGDRLIIEAGYAGNVGEDSSGKKSEIQYGKIFDGKIIYPSRHRENVVDCVLSLLAVDGGNALGKTFIGKTINRGLNQRQIIDVACKDATVKMPSVNITGELSEQRLPRGKVFFGAPEDYIHDVAHGNAATYWVENGELQIMKFDAPAKDEALVVTPSTGLIGMPNQTQDGASFTLLLNPNIHLGCMIQLKNSEINEVAPSTPTMVAPIDDEWIYQVIEFTHRGDTRGNDWYTECSAISRYGKGALPALMMNGAQNPTGG